MTKNTEGALSLSGMRIRPEMPQQIFYTFVVFIYFVYAVASAYMFIVKTESRNIASSLIFGFACIIALFNVCILFEFEK